MYNARIVTKFRVPDESCIDVNELAKRVLAGNRTYLEQSGIAPELIRQDSTVTQKTRNT